MAVMAGNARRRRSGDLSSQKNGIPGQPATGLKKRGISMTIRRAFAGAVFFLLSGVASQVGFARDSALVPGTLPPACNRECLYGFLDQYLAALVDKDPTKVPWARKHRFTENNVELSVGDGLWS